MQGLNLIVATTNALNFLFIIFAPHSELRFSFAVCFASFLSIAVRCPKHRIGCKSSHPLNFHAPANHRNPKTLKWN